MNLRSAVFQTSTVLFVLCAACGQAQVTAGDLAPVAATATTEVPRLVAYTGVATTVDGKALTGEVPVNFLLFKDQQGGEPLWSETQVVALDAAGQYHAKLGAGAPLGLPPGTFASGEGRWLEVQIAGQQPQPRVLLVSVPYAMKAADAATLGGLPASAFALAGAATATSALKADGITPGLSGSNVTTTGGTNLYLPKFSGATTVVDSEIYDTGTSIGIGNVPNPGAKLDVNGPMIMRGNMTVSRTGNATASKGYPSYGFDFFSNVYNSSSKAGDNPYFQLQSEPIGNNTESPSATFNLLFANNGSAVAETGFYINPDGTIHFASGQTYPGAADGTITGVVAGTDLTGGGSSGSVTLNVDTAKVPQLASANAFTAAQTITTGAATALTATGLNGISGVATGFGTGVSGSGVVGVAGKGGVEGVEGTGTQAGAIGVYGSGGGPSGLSTLGAGVVGTSNVGVIGYTTETATVTDNQYPITAGVYAQAGTISGLGMDFAGSNFSGLFADGGGNGGSHGSQFAILATTDDNTAVQLANSSSYSTLIVSNSGSGDVIVAGGPNGGACIIDNGGDLGCTGTLSGSNLTADKRALTTYGMQAAENWYEDAGSGQLQNGAAHIALDPSFGAVVNTEVEYHVFLTPNGESNNLYVTNKTAEGFDVRENGHGTSSISFDYRIMAKRKGYEALRLEDATAKVQARQERQLKMRAGRGVRGVSAGPAAEASRAADPLK